MITWQNNLCFGLVSFVLLCPALLQAEGMVRLSGIPGLSISSFSTEEYIRSLYLLAISIGAFVAVARIMIGGLKYIFTDIVTSKSEALGDIRGALLGLLIILAAVLILETINRDLVRWNVLDNLDPFQLNITGSNSTERSCQHSDAECLKNCLNPTGGGRGAVRCGGAPASPSAKPVVTPAPGIKTFVCTGIARRGPGAKPDFSSCEAQCKAKDGTLNIKTGLNSECTYKEI